MPKAINAREQEVEEAALICAHFVLCPSERPILAAHIWHGVFVLELLLQCAGLCLLVHAVINLLVGHVLTRIVAIVVMNDVH